MNLPSVQIDSIVCAGGLDMVTPTLSLKNGYARNSLNFECGVSGGYTRIVGYERFDGHTSPSLPTLDRQYISVASITTAPVVGQTLTASGGATGVIAYINGLVMVVTKITGTFAVGETVSTTALVGTVDSIAAGPASLYEDALAKNAVADIYRADIGAVPGSGPVRGVVEYNDVVYAFRNDASGTGLDIYESTSSGWSKIALYKTVSFTAGGVTAPAEGATLTQGGVTATIKRVVLTSGVWQWGTAAGQFIIATPAGGNFAAGAATIGAINITLSGAQTAITLLPGGKFEFEEGNFAGQATSRRIYGCDGVNKAFEFDGDILVPITTGATTDTPAHIAIHKNYLFLSLGSSVMHSAPGLPYDFTAIGGASEIATGDTVTAMIVMPGGTSTATLGIFSRSNTGILYGTSAADWNFVQYNTGTGAMAYSVKNMSQTLAFDDRGAVGIQAALQYGNFDASTLTNLILPFVNDRLNLLTYSTLNRSKSQYRLFFSDGYGLYITIVNGKLFGCMPVYYPNSVYCAYDGKASTGTDVSYFGSTNGYVYQFDKGTSFDGAIIPFELELNYSTARTPRTLKRYRKASLEVTATSETYATFNFGYSIGYNNVMTYEQPDNAVYSQFVSGLRWDVFTWDQFFWDSNSLAPVECEMVGTAENMAIAITGNYDYVSSFTINSMLVHFTPRRMMR